ncbi:13074_t:CDS:2 [Entrophospora sp. SA101]|nr:13074_t:CDS:2 [Entrophospora sp. SA101]
MSLMIYGLVHGLEMIFGFNRDFFANWIVKKVLIKINSNNEANKASMKSKSNNNYSPSSFNYNNDKKSNYLSTTKIEKIMQEENQQLLTTLIWSEQYQPKKEIDKNWYDQIMKQIVREELMEKLTKCNNQKAAGESAFMDDTTLIGNNLEGMTRLHQITKSFYKANDIKDNPNKSVESARYLGILIDGDGKIKSQKNKTLEFSRTAAAIARKKSITELQVTYLFNKVIIPAIEYKLQLCILSKQECIQIMNPFLQLFKVKAKLVRSFPTSAIKNIRLYNLTDLHNLQTQHHVTKLIIRLNSKGLMGDTTNIRLLDLQNKIWSDKCILQHIPTDPIPRGINLIYDILQLAKDAAITFCNHGTNDNTHSFNSESSTIKEILNNYKLFKQGLTFLQKYNIRFIKQLILTDGITLIKWQHLKSKSHHTRT